jgi:hypothetical protein
LGFFFLVPDLARKRDVVVVVVVVVEVVVVVPVGDTAVRRGGRVLVVKEGLRPIGHAIVGLGGVNERVGPTTHRKRIAATHRRTAPIMVVVGCGCGVVGVAVGGNCKGLIMTEPASRTAAPPNHQLILVPNIPTSYMPNDILPYVRIIE